MSSQCSTSQNLFRINKLGVSWPSPSEVFLLCQQGVFWEWVKIGCFCSVCLVWLPCFFSYTLLRMLHHRKRKVHDSTLRLWQGGILALCLSLPLGLLHLVSPGQQWLFLFGIFFIGGFAISVSIGMLYKIVPFLIWFHRFSSLVGQIRVPCLKISFPKGVLLSKQLFMGYRYF